MDISAIPWVLVVLLAGVLGTMVGFVDNYSADVLYGGRHAQAEKILYGPLYLITGIVILLIFQPSFSAFLPLLLLFGAGIVTSFGSIPYFAGLEREETTTAKIFAQLIPIFNLILSWVFLHQEIGGRQFLAFGIILAAPLTIILSKRRRSKRLEMRAAGFFLLNAVLSAISALLFVTGSNEVEAMGHGFLVCLAIFLCGKGCSDLVIMAVKRNWRKHFYKRVRIVKWRMFAVTGLNFAIWQTADLLYRFSMVQADSVALVSVTYEAVELIATFFLGVVLSLLWPSFGREKLDRRTVLVHLLATGLALVGILLIN